MEFSFIKAQRPSAKLAQNNYNTNYIHKYTQTTKNQQKFKL